MNAATLRRFTARLTAVTVPLAAAVALVGAPAQAGLVVPTPKTVGLPVAPTMTITIHEVYLVGFEVCVSGTSAMPGTWTANVDGARSDGSVIALSAPSHYGSVFSPPCFDVLENATPAGEWTVRLAMSRGDVTYARVGGGTWDLETHEHSWDTA